MKTFNKIVSFLEKPLNVMVFVVFLVMLATISLQVIARYVFNFGFAWTEELARYGMIWIVFLGAAIVHVREEKHVNMNVIEEIGGPGLKKVLIVVQEIIMLAFCFFIAYLGVKSLPVAAQSLTPGLKIAKAYPYIVFPITGVVMTLASVKRIVHLFVPAEKGNGKEAGK